MYLLSRHRQLGLLLLFQVSRCTEVLILILILKARH